MSSYQEEARALIVSAAARSLNVPEGRITPATDLRTEFDAKSINFVQIIAELEDHYEVEIDFMGFRNSGTVADEAAFVASLL